MSAPKINARLEHVTRKADRRKPEPKESEPFDAIKELGALVTEMNQKKAEAGEVGRLTVPGCLQLSMGTGHAETLAGALEWQLYRLEAEEKTLLGGLVRQPYLLDAVRAEIRKSHDLLNAVRGHLKTEAAGAMRAGEAP